MNDAARESRDEFRDLALAHLMGEITPPEAARFEAELGRRGAEGRAILRELSEAFGELALAAPSVDPPTALRERVLAAAAAEASSASDRWKSRRASPWPWAAAAVLAALALGLGVWAGRVAQERDRLQGLVYRLELRVAAGDSARARLAELRDDLDLATGPSSSVLGLVGSATLPNARARVFVDPVTGRALLFAYELPVLGPDRLYELWAIGDEGPRPAGVFRPDESGRARLEIEDSALLRDADVLAVTVEPAPGVEQPTGEIVLSGQT